MDSLQILDKIHTYYNDAFGHLITLVVAIVGIVGIFMPVLLTWFQNKNFAIEKKSIQAQILEELKTEIRTLFKAEKEQFIKQIGEESQKLNKKMKAEIHIAKGGIFMVQGQAGLDKGAIDVATKSYVNAIVHSLVGEDETNGQRSINRLIQACLPRLNKGHFDKEPELEEVLKKLIKFLEGINKNGRYYNSITSIKKGYASAKTKEMVTTSEVDSEPVQEV